MGAIDRTFEFQRMLQDLGDTSVVRGQQNLQQPRISNEVYTQSAQITHELTQISFQIEEMKKLNKNKSIFVDTTSQFGNLSAKLLEDMNRVKQMIEQLDAHSRSLSSSSNRNASESASNAVKSLQIRHKDTLEALMKVCKEGNAKAQKENTRKQPFKATRAGASAQMVGGQNYFDGNESEMQNFGPGGGMNDGLPLMMGQQQVRRGPNVFQDRANAMDTVQQTVNELATMFKQMQEMVVSHEAHIQRIDDAVDTTNFDLDAGTANLKKYLDAISANRTLYIKIFLIVICFTVFYVLFLT